MITLTTLRKHLSLSSSLHHCLLASAIFSVMLALLRVIVTGEITYISLVWNLFLGYIPYGITFWLVRKINIIENKPKLIAILTVWLLFVPNSFYIITDLFHLGEVNGAPKWYDLLLIFSFAWNALLFGIISIRRVELIIGAITSKTFSLLTVYVVMWLNAFGVYIGRYLRYNSWDVVTDPFSLASEIIQMILHPVAFGHAWAMTVCYSVFMTFLYYTIKKLSESFTVTS